MNYLILAALTLVTGVVFTAVGGIIGALTRGDLNRIFSLIMAFVGGLMLAVISVDLMNKPVELMDSGAVPPATPVAAFAAIIVGFLAVHALNHFIEKGFKNRAKKYEENTSSTVSSADPTAFSNLIEAQKSKRSKLLVPTLLMMGAIAVHNMFEGMIIGASYAPTDLLKSFISSGFLVAVVMGLHNITEGFTLSTPLIRGGENRTKTVLLTALSGLPTVFGALIGYALGSIGNMMLIITRCFAVGAIMNVVFCELMSEAVLIWHRRLPNLLFFGGIIVGLAMIVYL